MIKSTEQLRGMRGNYATYEDLVMRCCDIADKIEQEIEERYIELPKDANGEPIHVGDALQGKKVGGGWCEPFKVVRMDIDGDGWGVYELGGSRRQPRLCRHKPPTVEDVLSEFTDAIIEWAGESGTVAEVGTWSDIAADFAKRLQLKEEQ